MSLLLLPLGLVLPTIAGWLGLRVLEWNTNALLKTERVLLGALLGLTASMWLTFVVHVTTGLPLSLLGFLSVQVVLILITGLAFFFTKQKRLTTDAQVTAAPSKAVLWQKIVMILFGVWIGAKFLLASIVLVTTPPYFDDTLNNWNGRGKLFFYTQRLELMLMEQAPGEEAFNPISAYQPAVPFAKAYVSTLKGTWDEGLSNSVHIFWALCVFGLLYLSLRRTLPVFWSCVGVYLLASLPLYTMQATNPYADVFLSAHLFAAVSFLFHAIRSTDARMRMALFRIAAVATAFVTFTKNEGLVLYLPGIAVVVALYVAWMLIRKHFTLREALRIALWFIGAAVVVAGPWILFKWMNNMPFGNAKSLTDLTIAWQPLVLYSIAINTFFEGNWLLFFPLLITLLVLRWRQSFTTPVVILSTFILVVYGMQLPLYMFTNLSHEALFQTGYARGLIHIVPIASLLITLLLRDVFDKQSKE